MVPKMNEKEVMKCPKCGLDISDKYANYCPYCAAPLGGSPTEGIQNHFLVGRYVHPDRSHKRSSCSTTVGS